MSRGSRSLARSSLGGALLLLASLEVHATPTGRPEIALVAPVAGETLVAGGRMTLAWRAAEPVAFEEWEVFLSLDDGASWPVRLTPHLDAGIRRIEVAVPPLPSPRARLLLRYGDEREEAELLAPYTLEILPAPAAARVPISLASPRRGESARVGQSGVVRWVEGARDGRGWVERHSRETGWGTSTGLAGFRGLFAVGTESEIDSKSGAAGRLDARLQERVAVAHREALAEDSCFFSEPGSRRLSLLGRRNE